MWLGFRDLRTFNYACGLGCWIQNIADEETWMRKEGSKVNP